MNFLQKFEIVAVSPIAFVHNARADLTDDAWGDVTSVIELVPTISADALLGLEQFSHVEIVYLFHRVAPESIETTARHPRDNAAWPRVGIYAQRGKNRPNRIGTTIARLIRREGSSLHVQGLDAINGTPVLDIKPVMSEFLPREPVTQPPWATDLMAHYWDRRTA